MNNHISASFVSLNHIVTSSQRDAGPANASAGERPPHPLRLQRLARERDPAELSTTPNMALHGESTSPTSPVFSTSTCQPPRAHIRTAWAGLRVLDAARLLFPLCCLPLSLASTRRLAACRASSTDEDVWERITRTQQGRVREYNFSKKQVDAFRCRMEDALRAVTRHATLEAG